ILTGDFNASPESRCHQVFIEGDPEAGTADGRRFRNAFEPPYPATHHGFSGARIGDHIDWILYRGDLRLNCAKVIYHTVDGRYPSDHFPLWAEFHWASSKG